jgi:H+/Cl- antiporter ClcA
MAKWILVLTPVAVVVGSACALFLWTLEKVADTRFEHPWLLYLLPVAGVASAAMYHWFGRSVEGGNNLIVDEIHEPGGGVAPRIVPLIFLGTVVSHLSGASVGREGTAVQMGGGIASAFTQLFRLDAADRRTLLMAGIAAGFGAVFGTPIAGAVFAMEVLAVGRMEYGALIPVLYAALAADFTTAAWHIHHTAYSISVTAPDGGLPFDAWLMVKVVIGGAAFGLVAMLFAELAHGIGRLLRAWVKSPFFRPVIGAVITIAGVWLLGTREYLGLGVTSPHPGDVTIASSFRPGGADPFSWWWKVAFTAVAIGSGFKGGEVTPLFFMGATLGNRMAVLLHAPVDLFAGLGFVGVFAGAANTPLACTVMGIELFGAGNAPYIAVACFVAYLVSGHSGIYLSQRLGTPKVPAHEPASGARTLREAGARPAPTGAAEKPIPATAAADKGRTS